MESRNRNNAPSASVSNIERMSHYLAILLISIVVLLVLWPVTGNQLTTWDDKGYVTNNPLIRDGSFQGIKAIFSTPVMGNYHPLTILTYAWEYSMVELNPFLYHIDNLLLHLGATLLAYMLAFQLLQRKTIALICALLFGLHPMHVETVAWVADRKDSLSALFTFAACIFYVRYVRVRYRKWYAASLLMFLAAVLSKPVAVVLPISLLLIDYLLKRPINRKILLEKLPHFLIALVFGIVAFSIQHQGGAMDIHKEHHDWFDRVLLGFFALSTYMWKSLLPLDLKAIYPYPLRVGGTLPWYCFGAPVAIAAVAFALWKYRQIRVLVFGFLFFIVNIFLLLQFIPVGDAIVSERYAYLPYFGLFLVFAAGVDFALIRWRIAAGTVAALLLLAYATIARDRTRVWYDTYTLWADEIAKEPTRVPIAYNNIGFYFFERQPKEPGDIDSAIYYLKAATELQPDLLNAHEGLGILYYMNRNLDAAEASFWRLAKLRPDAESYYDLGAVWYEQGKKDSARASYSKALDRNPNHVGARLNRAITYQQLGRWEESSADIAELLKQNPRSAAAYYYRSFCDTQQQRFHLALQDVEKALSAGYRGVDTAYYRSLKNR